MYYNSNVLVLITMDKHRIHTDAIFTRGYEDALITVFVAQSY